MIQYNRVLLTALQINETLAQLFQYTHIQSVTETSLVQSKQILYNIE